MEILACVPVDEEKASAVLLEARLLAVELNAALSIVHVYPASWRGPLRRHPTAWHLMSDDPEEAVLRFAARRRITRVVC